MGKSRKESVVESTFICLLFCKVSRLELTSPIARSIHLNGKAGHCSCGAPSTGLEGAVGWGQQQCSCFWSHTSVVFKASTKLAMFCRAGELCGRHHRNTKPPSAIPVQGLLSIVPACRFLLPAPMSSHRGFSHRPFSCSWAPPLPTLEALQPLSEYTAEGVKTEYPLLADTSAFLQLA